MGCPSYFRLSSASSRFLQLACFFPLMACMLCAAGCNNTCISGTINPPNTTINISAGNPPLSCPLSTANAAVRLEIGSAPGAAAAPGGAITPRPAAPRITHLFVALAGVDAHASALAAEDAPGWQPLAAQLQAHPVQVDLLADPRANASSAALPEALLPAGVYRQVRLRLATAPLGEAALEPNRCGAGVPHCAVLSDGRIRPLAFPPSQSDVRIVSDDTPGHQLYVPPDGLVTLTIQLDADRSWAMLSGESLVFAPVFRVSLRPALELSEN